MFDSDTVENLVGLLIRQLWC